MSEIETSLYVTVAYDYHPQQHGQYSGPTETRQEEIPEHVDITAVYCDDVDILDYLRPEALDSLEEDIWEHRRQGWVQD